MPFTGIRSKWESGDLVFTDAAGTEVARFDESAAALTVTAGKLQLGGTAIAATAAELNALDFDDIEAVTATNDGLTTGIIADGKLLNIVAVTSAGANNIVTLPTPTPGTIVIGYVGDNGFELRSSAPATVGISGGTDTNAESAIPADTLFMLVCVSATSWLGWDLTGTTFAAIEAAA